MSEISHSDELVTKQDLSNFYQGILPYLGGMPEMLANKFNKSDLYSSEEKIVGRWTDGKPLYQKTIEITDFSAINTGQRNWYTLYVSSDAVYDRVFIKPDMTFMTWTDSNNKYSSQPNEYLIDTLTPPSYSAIRPYVASTGEIRVILVNSGTTTPYKAAYTNKKLYLTLQYTKTTDSAVNIGSEGDYSTTEKIVGTWIDGKPIYQKTMKVATPAVPTQGTQAVTDVPHGIQNIEARVSCTLHGNGNCQMFGNSNAIHYMMAFFDNTNVHIRTDSQTWQNSYVNVTMQYTKTTD